MPKYKYNILICIMIRSIKTLCSPCGKTSIKDLKLGVFRPSILQVEDMAMATPFVHRYDQFVNHCIERNPVPQIYDLEFDNTKTLVSWEEDDWMNEKSIELAMK